jgi:hypothetical protein
MPSESIQSNAARPTHNTGTVGGVTGITIVYPLDTAKMRCVRAF